MTDLRGLSQDYPEKVRKVLDERQRVRDSNQRAALIEKSLDVTELEKVKSSQLNSFFNCPK